MLEQRLKTINAGKTLDIASGAGDFIGFIKEMKSYDTITAIDSEERMGELIKKNFPDDQIEFFKMDAASMEFDAGSFDTVCVSNSLHHFKNPVIALKQAEKVLKSGGLLIINEMRSDNLSAAQKSHDLIHSFWAQLDSKRGVVHNNPFPAVQIKELVNNLVLKEIEVFEYSFPIDETQSKAQVDRLKNMLSTSLEKLKSDPDFSDLKAQSDKIELHLDEHGFAPAPSLFIIGRK